MSWKKSTTTAHTCGGPVFGRKTPGCPRCDELLDGQDPVRWDWADKRRRDEHERQEAVRAHFAPGGPHSRGECGAVCTYGDW